MKRIIAVLIAFLIVFSFASCGKSVPAVKKYNKEQKFSAYTSGIVAENNSWQLNWDSEKRRILLKNKESGIVWSTLPSELLETRYDEDGYEENNHPQLENPLILEYVDTKKMNINTLYAYVSSLQKGNYSAEKIDNGIKITYSFPSAEISVPVEYRLIDDGVNVSVDPLQITEGSSKIYRIALSPFFCSVKNDDGNGYLFVPSGSGTLITPIGKSSDVGTTCSYPVYGYDLQLDGSEGIGYTNHQPVRLPVFGAASSGKGTLAVIDSGSETADIDCSVGNSKIDYSTVYAAFRIRGKSASGSYSDGTISQKISVSYYPLSGQDANYIGMAKKYRSLLDGTMQKNADNRLLSLEVYGAAYTNAQILGVPYKKLSTLTTVSETEEMLNEIIDKTGEKPLVNLIGFGNSGIDTGKIGGGYQIASKLGNKKSIKSFLDFCSNNQIKAFLDFDIINFSKSGCGLSKARSYANSAIGQRAVKINRDFVTKKETKVAEYFAARNKTEELGKKAVDTALKNGFGGVSLTTASSSVYSDYSDRAYYNCGNYGKSFSAISDYSAKNKISVLASSANEYAALLSDYITASPLSSDKNDLFDIDIPFYQMVFKGEKPIYTASVNLSFDETKAFLSAAECGLGLQFSLIKNYSRNLLSASRSDLHKMIYDDLYDDIIEKTNDYKAYFEKVKNAKIVNHTITGDLRKTEFDNGITVYVNFGKSDIQTEIGTVAAESYIYN